MNDGERIFNAIFGMPEKCINGHDICALCEYCTMGHSYARIWFRAGERAIWTLVCYKHSTKLTLAT